MPHPSPIPELIRLLKSDPAPIFSRPPKNGPAGAGDVVIARAPARLDVMGGITELTGGLVCALPLQAAAAVAVQRRDDRKLVIKTYNAEALESRKPGPASPDDSRVELSLDDFYGSAALLPNNSIRELFTGGRHWAAYIAGAFPMLAKHKRLTRRSHGANIACYSNVPFGVGLGSSAAVACATLSALTVAFHFILDPMEIALIAQKLEQQVVGSARGILDQTTAVLGKQSQLLLLKCQPHDVQGFTPVPAGFAFVGINSGIAPAVGGPEYRNARTSAIIAQTMISRIYKDFAHEKDPTRGYLANVPPDMFNKYFRALLPTEILGRDFVAQFAPTTERTASVEPAIIYKPRAAAEHHIGEHARSVAFVDRLTALTHATQPAEKQALAIALGQLMRESHQSYSQNASLGHEATDLLATLASRRGPDKGFYGSHVMGVGAGGSIVLLMADHEEARRELSAILSEYHQQTTRQAQLLEHSSPGANEVAPIRVTPGDLQR